MTEAELLELLEKEEYTLMLVKREPWWSVAIAYGITALGFVIAAICLAGMLTGCGPKLDIPTLKSPPVQARSR